MNLRIRAILVFASLLFIATPSLAYDSRCYDADGHACAEGPTSATSRWLGPSDEHRQIFDFTYDWAGVPAELPRETVWTVFTDGSTFDFTSELACSNGSRDELIEFLRREFGVVHALVTGENPSIGADAIVDFLALQVATDVCPHGGECVDDVCVYDELPTAIPSNFLDVRAVRERARRIGEFAQLPDFSWSLWDFARGNEECPIQDLVGPDLDIAECHAFTKHLGAYNSSHFPPQSQRHFQYYHGLALDRAAECRRVRMAVPQDRLADFDRYLKACESQALTLDAIAAHYLHDAWSAGHMWERWGSANPRDLDSYAEAHFIGIYSGLIHGAEAVISISDAMCSPHPNVSFASPVNGAGGPMAGDLYLAQILEEERYGSQNTLLRSCAAAAMSEIYDALGNPYGEAIPADGLVSVDPSGADCFGQRATNLSLYQGIGLDSLKSEGNLERGVLLLSQALPFASEGTRGDNLTDDDRAFLEGMAGVDQVDDQIGRLLFRMSFWAKTNPNGTEMATHQLPALFNTERNSSYALEAGEPPSPYADPPLPWTPADTERPGAERGVSLARAMHRAHAGEWCSIFEAGDAEFDLERLRDRAQSLADDLTAAETESERQAIRPVWEAACDVCVEFADRHVRAGTSSNYEAEPFCFYAAEDPENVQYVYAANNCTGRFQPPVDGHQYCGCPRDECRLPGAEGKEFCAVLRCDGAGCSNGDPHLTSMDGVMFDFQGLGEFLLASADDGGLEVQVRQEQSFGICSGVSQNTAVAVEIGGSRVTITNEGLENVLRVDGVVTRLIEPLYFDDCSFLTRRGDNYFFVAAPADDVSDPDLVKVRASSSALGIDIDPGGSRTFSGLLGSNDGDPTNDITPRGGQPLMEPVDWTALHRVFGLSWLVDAQTTLFDYAAQEGPDTFRNDAFPEVTTTTDQLPDDVRTSAEELCRSAGISNASILEDCVVDVGCTGDESFAVIHGGRVAGSDLEVSGIVTEAGTGVVRPLPAPVSLEAGQIQSDDFVYLIEEAQSVGIGSEITLEILYPGLYMQFGDDHEANCPLTSAAARVDSHLLYWDYPFTDEVRKDLEFEYTFDSPVIGIIYTTSALEASDRVLGVPGTTYPTSSSNGLRDIYAGIELKADRRTLRVMFSGDGSIERLRVLTASTPAADGSAPGLSPKSCNEHLQQGSTTDGVYRIDPDGAGGLAPFDVFCDMTTDGGGWTLATKVSAGVPGTGACVWGLGQVYESTGAGTGRTATTAHYANELTRSLWNANGFTVSEARVEVIDNGGVAQSATFDAAGSTFVDWFADGRLTAATWSDLVTEPKELIAINPRFRRNFLMSRDEFVCSRDEGWLLMTAEDECPFTENPPGGHPGILYAPGSTYVRWADGPFEFAEAMTVFVR